MHQMHRTITDSSTTNDLYFFRHIIWAPKSVIGVYNALVTALVDLTMQLD